MMTWKQFWKKVRRRLMKLRLQPIRVFCFHQVSNEFEPDTMWECDWTQTEVFKQKILALKNEYTFVPLTDAYHHIANDKIRFKKYAALTADDGWASLKNIIPWLAEQQIPVTLFLNPCYLDGKHYQSRETEKLLTLEDVKALVGQCKPFVTLASHGWEHGDCTKMSEGEFEENVLCAEKLLADMDGKIPFYAFAYGYFAPEQVVFLEKRSLIPVLIDGEMNYNERSIHRECIDNNMVNL